MILLEALPSVLAAGAICGWALAPLTGSELDLSVFTGGTAGVPVHADAAALVIAFTRQPAWERFSGEE